METRGQRGLSRTAAPRKPRSSSVLLPVQVNPMAAQRSHTSAGFHNVHAHELNHRQLPSTRKMALRSVSYALTAAVPTATGVAGWDRGYLRPCVYGRTVKRECDGRWRGGLWSSTTNIERQKYTSRDRGRVSNGINTHNSCSDHCEDAHTHTHTKPL